MSFTNYWYSSGEAGSAPPIPHPLTHSLRFDSERQTVLERNNVPLSIYDDLPVAPQYAQGTVSFWYKKGWSYAGSSGLYNVCTYDQKVRSRIKMDHNDTTGGSFVYNNRYEDNNDNYYYTLGKQGDPSAWYHLFCNFNHFDNTRNVSYWINGVKQLDIVPSRNEITFCGTTQNNQPNFFQIGWTKNGDQEPFDSNYATGQMCDFYCLNTYLEPEDFGFFNEMGIWQPKTPELVTADYGPAGFHLTFDPNQDPDPYVGIGIDSSGNGNHFESKNFQLDDPTSWFYDAMMDSPTHNRANFNTQYPNNVGPNSSNEDRNRQSRSQFRFAPTTDQGTYPASLQQNAASCIQPTAGSKLLYQIAFEPSDGTQWGSVTGLMFAPKQTENPIDQYNQGICFNWQGNIINGNADSENRKSWFYSENDGNYGYETAITRWPQLPGEPDTSDSNYQYELLWVGAFYDEPTGDIWILCNNYNGQWTPENWNPVILKPDGTYVPYNGTLPDDCKYNFPNANIWNYRTTRMNNRNGPRSIQNANAWEMMEGALPNGFRYGDEVKNLPKAPIPVGKEHFTTVKYTGNGTSQTIDTGFAPDIVWIKAFSKSADWMQYDIIRGPLETLSTNVQGQNTTVAETLTSFNANGFTVGNQTNVNQDGQTYIAYAWKGGGAGVANNDGTATSTVSANPKAGISVVKYTGSADTQTLGHGLDRPPAWMCIKCLTKNGNWANYTSAIGPGSVLTFGPNTAQHNQTNSGYFNDTSPTDKVFTVGPDLDGASLTNGVGHEYIAWCFAETPGFSQAGTYIGNGNSIGPYINTGFAPQFVINTSFSVYEYWYITDNSQNEYNDHDSVLRPERNQGSDTGYESYNYYANGFKLITNNGGYNSANQSFWWFAFAQYPYGGRNCYPATGQ